MASIIWRRFLFLVALVVTGSVFPAVCAERKSATRITVLDFKAPPEAGWLGPAVSEAVSSKLAGIGGVALLERNKVRAILISSQGKTITPELLGAQYILTGTVQIAGKWPDTAAKLRISAKVIAAGSGQIKGKSSFLVDGTVGDLFRLESRLAKRFASAFGREVSAMHLNFHEVQNLVAKKLFGQGLVCLSAAENALAVTEKSRSGRMRKITPSGKSEIIKTLNQAIDFFKCAQQKNEGAFFCRAHFYEGNARELKAQCQKDSKDSDVIRAETVKKFREDAGRAAPAFFDLGRALEAAKNYRAALDAYGQYHKWMQSQAKTIRWHQRKVKAGLVGVPAYFGSNIPFSMGFEYIAGTPKYLLLMYYRKLTCYRRNGNQKLWTAPVPGKSTWREWNKHFLNANDKITAILHNQTLSVFSTDTGKSLFSGKLDLKEVTRTNPRARMHTMTMIYLPTAAMPDMLIVGKAAITGRMMQPLLFKLKLVAVDLAQRKISWQREWKWTGLSMSLGPLPFLWDGSLIFMPSNGKGLEYIDAVKCQDVSERFSTRLRTFLGTFLSGPIAFAQILPDASGKGVYLVKYLRRRGAIGPIYYLASPVAEPRECKATRIATLMGFHPYYGGFGNMFWRAGAKVGEPWLGYDLFTRSFGLYDEPLPLMKNLRPVMNYQTLEAAGLLTGKRLWYRSGQFGLSDKGRGVRVYDLHKDKPPTLAFAYNHPWRIFSMPVVDYDSTYLFVSETGMGGCDLIKACIANAEFGGQSEIKTLGKIALCHELMQNYNKAIETLERAVAIRYDLPEYHARLMRLLLKSGEMGKCMFECERIISLEGRESALGREAYNIYKKMLKVVKGTAGYLQLNFMTHSLIDYQNNALLGVYDMSREKVLWEKNFGMDSFSLWRGDRMIVCVEPPEKKTKIYSLDLTTGRIVVTRVLGMHEYFIDSGFAARHQFAAPEEWRKKLPVFAFPRDDKSTEIMALDPVTLKTIWTGEVPRSGGGYRYNGFTVHLDRVTIGTYRDKSIHLQCRKLQTGTLLWERDVPSVDNLARSQRAKVILQSCGGAFTYSPTPDWRSSGNFSVLTGKQITTKGIDKQGKWLKWNPQGERGLFDASMPVIPYRHPDNNYLFCGHIWPGGPVVTRSCRARKFALVDPHTLRPICESIMGFTGRGNGASSAIVRGDWIISHSYLIDQRRIIVCSKSAFLRVMGWTRELAIRYRANAAKGLDINGNPWPEWARKLYGNERSVNTQQLPK